MPARKLTLLPLVAATYFMVCGGSYGLEELVQKTGYSRSVLILLITPLIGSLPTALMVGELPAPSRATAATAAQPLRRHGRPRFRPSEWHRFPACGYFRRFSRRHPGRHVELHGLGQRLDGGGRSGASATHLSLLLRNSGWTQCKLKQNYPAQSGFGGTPSP